MKKVNIKDILFSGLMALTVTVLCLLFFTNFFNIDDALNEALGFQTQFGKAWLSGNIPFIVPDIWVGGNAMIDLQHSIFAPQTIIASIMRNTLPDLPLQASGILIALINLVLIIFSSLTIARKLNIKSNLVYGFATFIAIQPMFLYQYSAAWWMAANGQAWAIVSIATYLMFIQQSNARNACLNFVSVIFLLSSGWPHGTIGYLVFLLITSLFSIVNSKSIRTTSILALPSILAIIFAFPLYSEYLLSLSLTARESSFHNVNKHLVPPWSMLLMSFSPVYYDFMHYFKDYRLVLLPLAFTSVLLPVAFFYRKVYKLWIVDWHIKLLFTLVISFFLLSQMTTQFGPLRYPFRFIPFFSFFLTLITFYVLDKAEKTNTHKWTYRIFIILASLLSLAASLGVPGTGYQHTMIQLISLGFLLILPALFNNSIIGSHASLLPAIALGCLLIMLTGLNTQAEKYLPFRAISPTIEKHEDVNFSGFMMSLNSGHNPILNTNDLRASQFGIFDIATINGYSPIRNKYLGELLAPKNPTKSTFNPIQTLDNILIKRANQSACIAEIMRISTFIIPERYFKKQKYKLADCGYVDVVKAGSHRDLYVSLPKDKTQGWQQRLPYVSSDTLKITVQQHNNNSDIIKIPQRDHAIELIFPRVWWPGYTAYLDNSMIPVKTDASKALVRVEVPAGKESILTLSYFPLTWRYLWFMPLFSIISLIVLCMKTKRSSV